MKKLLFDPLKVIEKTKKMASDPLKSVISYDKNFIAKNILRSFKDNKTWWSVLNKNHLSKNLN
jgi:hypothetical protein